MRKIKLNAAQIAHRCVLGRERARRWRERHASEIYGLQTMVAVAAIDAAISTALIEEHMRVSEAWGARDPALLLRAVVQAARLAPD